MSDEAEDRDLEELDRDISKLIWIWFLLMAAAVSLLLLILWRVW